MIDLGEDAGRTEVTINGQTATLDIWQASCRLMDLDDSCRSPEGKLDVERFHSATVDYLRSLGYLDVSHFTAARFIAAVMKRARQLEESLSKKADSPDSPASGDSTGSTPSG